MCAGKFQRMCGGAKRTGAALTGCVAVLLVITLSCTVADAATFPGAYTHNSGITILPQLTASTLTINSGQLILDAKSQARDPAGTSIINSLVIRNLDADSFSPAGALDVTNNALIIDYEYSYPIDSIRKLIQSGFNSGKGIVSTATNLKSRLAYADNSVTSFSTFGQAPVDASSVLITLTYSGDANLDGVVNLMDLYSLASNWQSDGSWTSGDFNYDGTIDAVDLQLLASNWQAGIVNAPIDPGIDDLFTSVVTSLTSVPEPLSFGGFCVLACALLRPRSRR